MRLLLTCMAMAVLAISLGCDKKADESAAPKTTGETTGEKAAMTKPAGDSATAKTTGTQTVSLKLPGMT